MGTNFESLGSRSERMLKGKRSSNNDSGGKLVASLS